MTPEQKIYYELGYQRALLDHMKSQLEDVQKKIADIPQRKRVVSSATAARQAKIDAYEPPKRTECMHGRPECTATVQCRKINGTYDPLEWFNNA